jgi:hypothetical protein
LQEAKELLHIGHHIDWFVRQGWIVLHRRLWNRLAMRASKAKYHLHSFAGSNREPGQAQTGQLILTQEILPANVRLRFGPLNRSVIELAV